MIIRSPWFGVLMKLLGAGIGVAVILMFPSSFHIQAFFLGVLPIWLEVLATHITGIEPARVVNSKFLRRDAVADCFVFVWIPAIWFSVLVLRTPSILIACGIFVIAGQWRILRFLKRGLVNGQFVGLPVTYTGYLWVVLVSILMKGAPSWIPFCSIVIISWAMLSSRIRLNPAK